MLIKLQMSGESEVKQNYLKKVMYLKIKGKNLLMI